MRLLYCGDVIGRAGREAIAAHVPMLRTKLNLDFVVVNGENAAHGFGLTSKIAEEFYALGVDVITLGNHTWDQREIIPYLDSDPRLIRPLNYPKGTPGRGAAIYAGPRGRKIMVIQVMGRLYMDPLDCPFAALEQELSRHPMISPLSAIIIDVHGEATSEKMAIGHVLDGRVSMVVGSHSHIPTADAQILPKGTAYQTDAGMCADYDSVIGMKKDAAIFRMARKIPGERLSPAEGEGTLCAVFVETDDHTGLARQIAPIRLGPRLITSLPHV